MKNLLILFLLRQTGMAEVKFEDRRLQVFDNGKDGISYVVERRVSPLTYNMLYTGEDLSTALEWLEGTISNEGGS